MCVLLEKKDHIAYLKYDRPEARNAFSPELIVKMARALEEIDRDKDIWVVILGSTTPGMFSAGADLKLTIPLLNGRRKPENEYDKLILNDMGLFRKGTLKADATDRPIIAAIDGFCVAAALEAVMGTDIRVASTRSQFGLPEVSRGIVAWGGGTSKLPQQIPLAKALEMNLTGRTFSAAEMLEMHFLNAVVGENEVWEKAEFYARQITENAPLAVRAAKKSIKACIGRPTEEAMEIEQRVTHYLRKTEDAKEGPLAFAEKRKPVWKAE